MKDLIIRLFNLANGTIQAQICKLALYVFRKNAENLIGEQK